MSIKQDSSKPSFSCCISKLEAQVAQVPSHFLRILDDDGSLLGFCLLSPELAKNKREGIENGIRKCAGITLECCEENKSSAAKIALMPKSKAQKDNGARGEKECGYEYFMENMHAVSHQASLTRIPFSLLLFQSDDFLSRQEVAALIGKCQAGLNREEIFSIHHPSRNCMKQGKRARFAVIMPSAGLSKARRRAEEIRQAVCSGENSSEKKMGLSIGLGVSYAGEGISVQDFLSTVERSLQDAAVAGNSTRWERGARSTNSCQVTAEERAQLFGCLK